MSKYVLVETKSPLDNGDWAVELGRQLKEQRHEVIIYLLQDAVLAARRTFEAGQRLRRDAEKHGLTLLADGVSLRQRGVVGNRVAKGIRTSDMDELVDLLMERSDKAIWH